MGTIWRRVMGWRWWQKALASLFLGYLLLMAVVAIAGTITGDSDGETDVMAPAITAPPSATADARATDTAKRVATVKAENVAAFRASRPTPAPDYQLALVSASCTIRADIGFTECQGFVKNISGAALNNIQVVVTWYDASDVPQVADDALIDFRPILREQVSPWSTIGTYNPALSNFRVQFKEFLGGTILTRDDRE